MAHVARKLESAPPNLPQRGERIPPHAYFVVSAVFHYLGPAFAVLLFKHVAVLGVAWLRIGSAAAIFALWRRPFRVFAQSSPLQRRTLLGLGVVLGLMNACFYLAISRLPLSTVGTIEFLGPLALAAMGVRSRRNGLALVLAVAGVVFLTRIRLSSRAARFLLRLRQLRPLHAVRRVGTPDRPGRRERGH